MKTPLGWGYRSETAKRSPVSLPRHQNNFEKHCCWIGHGTEEWNSDFCNCLMSMVSRLAYMGRIEPRMVSWIFFFFPSTLLISPARSSESLVGSNGLVVAALVWDEMYLMGRRRTGSSACINSYEIRNHVLFCVVVGPRWLLNDCFQYMSGDGALDC